MTVGVSRMNRSTGRFIPGFDAVLAAAKQGDGRAFEQLYAAFCGPVAGFVRSRGMHDPDGIVNEAFLGAFTGLATFTGDEAGFEAWLFRIARNKLADELRRRSREPATYDQNIAADLAGGDVEADALAALGDEWVQRRLDALTPDQRDVLLLRVVADLPVDQTAEVLGKRPGAIKALQRRALRRLNRELRTEGVSK